MDENDPTDPKKYTTIKQRWGAIPATGGISGIVFLTGWWGNHALSYLLQSNETKTNEPYIMQIDWAVIFIFFAQGWLQYSLSDLSHISGFVLLFLLHHSFWFSWKMM